MRLEDVTIDQVSEPDRAGRRTFRFHDGSAGGVSAIVLGNVKTALHTGQKLKSLRGILHIGGPDKYEVIVELDQHVVVAAT